MRNETCPKCAIRLFGPAEICPGCGVIFAKVAQAEVRNRPTLQRLMKAG